MAERPPLPFLPPTAGRRETRPYPRDRPVGPGPGGQLDRLGPVFRRLRDQLAGERFRIADHPEAVAPELILVLEIAGELDEFVSAVSRVRGLEYLAEELGDQLDSTDVFAGVDAGGNRQRLRRELFVVATDERAAEELQSLWERWQAGQGLPRGWGRWRAIFERLISIRSWNDEDRLTRTGAVDAWKTELSGLNDELIPFEAELWYRSDPAKREAELGRFRTDVEEHGGRYVAQAVLDEIAYHGVLARLPARALRESAESLEVPWLSGRGVRFLRPVGQASFPLVEELEPADEIDDRESPEDQGGQIRVAVLDGVPVAAHRLLAGRITLDDPEGWEATTEVRHRQHGTAMASSVLHGDLSESGEPIPGRIYLRPIIRVDPAHDWVPNAEETIPVERLPVDLVHEAVVRMLDGEDAQAPDVRIINLSVADRVQQFDRFVSPWARLLDYLSARYSVLFVVSAGNHTVELVLPPDMDLEDASEVEHEALRFLASTANLRRLLAPSESVNALTVGCAHIDSSGELPDDGRTNPLTTIGLPAPLSSWGGGHGRSIKPDLLSPGGRELFDLLPGGGEGDRRLVGSRTSHAPGIRVAAPSAGGDLGRTTWTCGTSPATALVTRGGAWTLETLDGLRAIWGGQMPGPEFDAVLVKALLVHGCAWGQAENPLRDAMREVGLVGGKEDLQRPLGYGLARHHWASVDDDHRATALYAARIGADGEHEYRLPLPPSLARQAIHRRITVTLAWLTPINTAHRGYRRAALKVDPRGSVALAPDRQEASSNAAIRGTVQHEILEGADALAYAEGSDLVFKVSCRAAAGAFDETVPYAFVVTLETPEEIGLPIYSEIRERIQQRVARIRARAPGI